MSTTRTIMMAATAASLLAMIPSAGNSAGITLGGGEVVCPTNLDNGSCNLVFRNRMELIGLTQADLVETVYNSCPGFPNGPYQRVDTPIDYVVLENLNVSSPGPWPLSNEEINSQIGTDLPSGTATTVSIAGANGSTPSVTVKQIDANRSQIIDLPGFDFLLFQKSQGGGTNVGTLVCDIKMWYRDGSAVEFGVRNFTLTHPLNRVTVGWVAGPSGMRNQANATTACAPMITAAPDDPMETGLEKKISYLAGVYKVTQVDQVNPANLTGCGQDEENIDVLANYCDGTELNGTPAAERPNACNPKGGTGNIAEPTIAGASGNATECYYRTARGSFIYFNPC